MNWELILPYLLGGGSAIYLLWEKLLSRLLPNGEDRKSENEASSIGMDYIVKVDEYQTRKLSDVIKDIEEVKNENAQLREENRKLLDESRKERELHREEQKASNDKLLQAYEEIQKLQKLLIEKNNEVLKANQDAKEARAESAAIINMACVRVAEGTCKRQKPYLNQDESK